MKKIYACSKIQNWQLHFKKMFLGFSIFTYGHLEQNEDQFFVQKSILYIHTHINTYIHAYVLKYIN